MTTLRGQAGRWSWEMFLLGAAFMLLETKSIIQFALLWGSTWFVASLVIAAVLVAAAVSDSLGDVRAWTLVSAVAIGYMLSRGLAKSGTRYTGGEDLLGGGDPVRGIDER